MIWVLFKLIWGNEKRSKFQKHHCRNSEKKYERGERNDVTDGERKRNFGNDIVENKKIKK